jgi:hypothetical protein
VQHRQAALHQHGKQSGGGAVSREARATLARALLSSRAFLACGALLTVLTVVPSRALAYHSKNTPSLEDSAYLLRDREWQLGLQQFAVGLGPCQLSTRTFPWFLGFAYRKLIPNLGFAATMVERRGVTLSGEARLFYINSRGLSSSETIAHVFLVPVALATSWRINDRHTTSLIAKYVRVMSVANTDEGDLNMSGTALADNFQVTGSWEWRMRNFFALLLVIHYLPYQGDAVFHSDVNLDDRTHAKVQGEADAEHMQNTVAGSLSSSFSWKHFNLRMGFGYGAFFMPGMGLVLPLKYPFPEFNFYWRI